MNELVGVEEAAKILGVKISWIRNSVYKKTIRHVKIGRLVKFRRKDLEEMINNVTPAT